MDENHFVGGEGIPGIPGSAVLPLTKEEAKQFFKFIDEDEEENEEEENDGE